MSNKLLIFSFSFFCFLFSFAQKETDSLRFDIHLKWKNESLTLHKNYVSKNDTLQLDLVKFYLSNFEIEYQDGTFFKEKESYHLINFENLKPFSISTKENKVISKIKFCVGIDSLTNVSGALAGSLDATQGMYWAWQSGYINIKMEGKSNSCQTRNHKFQFHIGGYLPPNVTLRKIDLAIDDKKLKNNTINLNFDIEKLFNVIQLKEFNTVMIPGNEAVFFSDIFQKIISIE